MNTARRRRVPVWLWVLGSVSLLSIMVVAMAALWLAGLDPVPLHVVIDGTEYTDFDLSTLTTEHRVGIAIAAVVALIVAILVVPLALLIALGGALVGVLAALVFGVGVPLAVMLLVVALLTAPVWLLGALVWWLWRRSSAPAPAKIAG
jgi:hypothetical protein